ncbi:hypothetical protein COL26b_010323 [Colletotrichum chrysophilum]|uniref:uncharacterized protein n=1 Tax=Colletotrichum chrysophilum TaxID=1836956 RepID=UPI0023014E44|nr:uncharacterized protein COL26b_010323 [Colletotrichum chrysophilum]KAJ0369713.1 hypothetical protein COL26b_010323 [Colletotrichum chrysophilum]
MEIILPVRKPRENSLPWPPPRPSLRPALSGRPGPETIPHEIFICIIESIIDDTIAFLATKDDRTKKIRVVECTDTQAPDASRLEVGNQARGYEDCMEILEMSQQDSKAQKKRYRLLRLPLGTSRATRNAAHRGIFPYKLKTGECVLVVRKPLFNAEVPWLICPEIDSFYIPEQDSGLAYTQSTSK